MTNAHVFIKKIFIQNKGNADKCEGAAFESQTCNNYECPVWSEWSQWSKCIDIETKLPKPCGMKERVRVCESERKCDGDAYERSQF